MTPDDVLRESKRERPPWRIRLWLAVRRPLLFLLPITLLVTVVVLNYAASGAPALTVATAAVFLALAFALGVYGMATLAATAPSRRKPGPHGPDCGCEPDENAIAMVGCQGCGWQTEVRTDQARAAVMHHIEYECPHGPQRGS